MRILIASGIFHPDSGGPATYLYRLLPELQKRGDDLRVLTYGDAPTTGYPYPVQRIPFTFLPLRLLRYAIAYRQFAAWADLIYINTLSLPHQGDSNRPRVMKIVGDYAWERSVNRGLIPPNEDIDAFQKRRYGPLVEWFKASRAQEAQQMDHVIVPSNYLREMVIGWGVLPARVQVIYNALEVDQYAPTLSQAEAQTQLGWSGRYLVTLARLTAWKGVDMLIDALARVPDIKLVVLGDGPQWESLRARAAPLGDRVLFLGKVPHDRVPLYLRAADYFALYSGYEGLSHSILEALYAGTPVIASNRGGNPETVRDGVNGLLVAHPDLDALTDTIRRAFDGDLRAKLAANTRIGLERFSWPDLVEQTVKTLHGLATP